ncbi:MAG: M28 family peptidase [Saccharofermentanales bacterium]|jgi:alkaline phosphatase isozyme conversion protein
MIPLTSRARRAFVLLLVLSMLLTILAGCSDSNEETTKPAAYGSFGADFARTLADANPDRAAGSPGENKTGDLIIEAFTDLGYEPVISAFSFPGSEGSPLNSRNIAVLIPGSGVPDPDNEGKTVSRQIIIGAHYDAPPRPADVKTAETQTTQTSGTTADITDLMPGWEDYDGISDNASSIGALMVMARELKTMDNTHDVILVAFGAGHANQAGARFYVEKMKPADIERTEVMYNLENIYAGDKLYANAGQNSIKPGFQKDYEKRRKLYEATDVYYEYELFSNNRVALYTNQSVIETDQNRLNVLAPYREWTTHPSDHLPFDEADIPIVFFESFDYDVATMEEMRESNNPAFTASNGKISGTPFDSTDFLEHLFEMTQAELTPTPLVVSPAPGVSATPGARTTPGADSTPGASVTPRVSITPGATTTEEEPLEDLLTRRINNTAFIIIKSIEKSSAAARETTAEPSVTPAITPRSTTRTATTSAR